VFNGRPDNHPALRIKINPPPENQLVGARRESMRRWFAIFAAALADCRSLIADR